MKLQVFAVRDSKSQTFGNPFVEVTTATALRSIANEVNKGGESSILHTHPEDFELFHLGEWDPTVARYDLFPDPRALCVCAGLKNGS